MSQMYNIKRIKQLDVRVQLPWKMSSSYYETVQDFDCDNIYEDKHTKD